ncbi:putative phosphatidylinositol 4,5-bisphosphate-binding protein [Clavispora lusitaniae]|uniref:PH domain-containing protein n=3 Tax=Clavispora lusitaniae TaxID=36911 RepID=C4Y2F6_CLAL4|nr:uncharacterized protein CLUG_02719 [Clavispora lusitaniae ATCC 42720]KAF5211197.1 hypothetical protein E0198_002495 [Clavispora lusitaniae]EEQ38593.1 hypothetical protein CLUG_02719 [Clavispora lusitaniae ATCC 42720]KAF7580015.1 PH domain family protein [Clavispora lusitaniae]OVF08668.1 putative phosphatidylinositol 4,5-bisphosphate-binding protein [Clavispora lusitaniae]QFZ27573.1 putative phosphatidylinositol 4,5-bisphosphate-binding protein [Clavispora lusitaniae]
MERVLPQTDPRSPFNVNVPPQDAKPIHHLVAYFKLWKHFISALVAYLKDLVMAKEFESNLNLQLVGSVQFPGFKDLAYKCLSSVEQQISPQATPKSEKPPSPASNPIVGPSAPGQENKRPGLAKTKSASSFLKNQTFAHHRSASSSSLKSEYSGKQFPPPKHAHTTNSSTPPATIAAKYVPKNDVSVDPAYFPPDSMFSGTPQALINHHMNTYSAQARLCREVTHKLIPRLENLHKNLGLKIKEIRSSLKNDSFANPTLVKEVSKTGAILSTFVSSVQRYSGPKPVLKKEGDGDDDDAYSMSDPFLVKLRLDYQLKNQLIHENYIFASYVNLQNISKDLLTYVVKDLSSVAERMIRATNNEAVYASSSENVLYNMGVTLKHKLNASEHEWQHFISHNPNFVNTYQSTANSTKREMRRFKDIVIPFADSLHSKCLRCGFMYKKQKLIKSYTSYFYLLTCNYLHEFKIESEKEKDGEKNGQHNPKKKSKGKVGGFVGHNDTPTKSYNLNDYSFSVKNESDFKFVLTKISNTSSKFTFKCSNETDFINWTTDLFDLLKFGSNHLKRFKFIEEKMAMRKQDASESEKPPSQDDLKLQLKGLLSADLSMNKIQGQPSSLSGIFTPKINSPPDREKNPFENTFGNIGSEQQPSVVTPPLSSSHPESPASDFNSEGASSQPVSPGEPGTESSAEHQKAHENYLKLQHEIMKQQEQLVELNLAPTDRPSLSRHSSTESMLSVMEQNNHNLSDFLHQNRDLMKENTSPPINDSHSSESLAPVPTVYVSHHTS